MKLWIIWLKKHKPWTWVFSGIGVAVFGWVFNGAFSELQSQPLELDRFWQDQVEQMIHEGKLDSPPGNGYNAYDTVRIRLNEYPNDLKAKLFLHRISEVFIQQAEIAIDKNQIHHAQRYAIRAKTIWPKNPYLDNLLNELSNPIIMDSLPSVVSKSLLKTDNKADLELGKQIFSRGKYWALLIANQNYINGISSLQTPLNNVKTLEEILKKTYGFYVVTIRDASKNEIIKALYSFQTKVNKDDSLMIYYAGHGEQEKGFKGKGFWIPIDGMPPYSESKEKLSSWVSNSFVNDIIQASSAKHVLLISESAFSGPFKSSFRIREFEKFNAPSQQNSGSQMTSKMYSLASLSSRRAITSGDLEPVEDGETGGHSIFSHYLIKELKENKVLTSAALFEKIRKSINKLALQTPHYFITDYNKDERGDFIFVPKSSN